MLYKISRPKQIDLLVKRKGDTRSFAEVSLSDEKLSTLIPQYPWSTVTDYVKNSEERSLSLVVPEEFL